MKRTLRTTPRGMALIEAVVSMVVLSVMLVAALNTVGASRLGQRGNADLLRAAALASDLMAEVMDKSYADPGATPVWGPEPAEILAGRSTYDDVDDYDQYTESPPKDRSGTVIPGLSGWKRDVAVAYVNPLDLTQAVVTDSGVKRVMVTVSRGTMPLIKLVSLRTSATPR